MTAIRPSLNLCLLIGELLTAPEVRFTAKGSAKASFRVETARPLPDGRVFTDRHNVVWWGKSAESAERLRQGDLVQVTGRIGTRSYTGRDGGQRWITEVTARDVVMFGVPSQAPPHPSGMTAAAAAAAAAPVPGFDDDEDIPF